MRNLVIFLLAICVSPALAADWGSYENARFGYVIDVPPDFEWGEEAQNGDGRVFTKADGTQSLRVYGGNILEDDFELAAGQSAEYFDGEGWDISYQRTTPDWASFSGTRSGKVAYVRMIALCDGTQYATFELEYPTRDISRMDRTVDRLVGSLRDIGNGVSC